MSIRSAKDYACQEILSEGWIQHVDWQPQVDSTNERAKQWMDSSTHPTLPALFVADVQTAGRGRNRHQWWSPRGCLMLTLVVDDRELSEQPASWSQLSLVAGVAVADTVETFVSADQSSVQIKWPNDVYVHQRKCAGILVESLSRSHVLIGIGINVDVDWAGAPPGLAERATSIARHSLDSRIDAPQVLVECIKQLQLRLADWASGDSAWLAVLQQRCLLSGREVRIRFADSKETTGLCEGLDASGNLLLRCERGVQRIHSGEVVYWR